MLGSVRDGEDFGAVRKESEFCSTSYVIIPRYKTLHEEERKENKEAFARVQTGLGKPSICG
jgi:hypothetical protein